MSLDSYVEGAPFIDLGGMVHALRLTGGRTGDQLSLLQEFRAFLQTKLRVAPVLERAFTDDCAHLSKLRNPAAHVATCGRDDAVEARSLALRLLAALTREPASELGPALPARAAPANA